MTSPTHRPAHGGYPVPKSYLEAMKRGFREAEQMTETQLRVKCLHDSIQFLNALNEKSAKK